MEGWGGVNRTRAKPLYMYDVPSGGGKERGGGKGGVSPLPR